MDILVNLQAFLATADAAGFSAAARKLGVSTSVVAKRVTQLEARIGTPLFHRSTRQLRLTAAGRRYVHRARGVVTDATDLLSRMGEKDHDLVDHLRIKAPTSLTVVRLADIFTAFQTQNPRLKLDIVLFDRPVDPVTEGFDIAIGAFPHSFGGVVDEPLCPLKRLLCASPAYLKKHGGRNIRVIWSIIAVSVFCRRGRSGSLTDRAAASASRSARCCPATRAKCWRTAPSPATASC
jgi:DNA-binding transcriptional LysR family regulator